MHRSPLSRKTADAFPAQHAKSLEAETAFRVKRPVHLRPEPSHSAQARSLSVLA